MVLNVFHFAGVAQMQITQGLPRLIEILDARKQPSTPLMELYLDKEHNTEEGARAIAERVKEVKLREIISELNVDFGNKKIEMQFDAKALKRTHIAQTKIVEVLGESKKFKVQTHGTKVVLMCPDLDFKKIYKLKEKLKEFVVSGVKGIEQVMVTKKERDYVILTKGSNIREVLEVKGINTEKVFSNDVHDVEMVLGIEAARQTIVNEIKNVLQAQGLDINHRHLELVADAMTSSGVVKGVTRMGIITDKASVLARATFETPDKQFINATIKGAKDELNSVVENILINQPIPVGTGLPGLLVKVTGPLVQDSKKKNA